MDNKQATQHFKEADRLYREQRYGEALAILELLDSAYPNTRHILFPKARCLAKLYRTDEARAICERLISEHHYDPARELLVGLNALDADPALPRLDLDVDTEIAALKREPAKTVVLARNKPSAARGIWIAAALVAVAVIGALIVISRQSSSSGNVKMAKEVSDTADRKHASEPSAPKPTIPTPQHDSKPAAPTPVASQTGATAPQLPPFPPPPPGYPGPDRSVAASPAPEPDPDEGDDSETAPGMDESADEYDNSARHGSTGTIIARRVMMFFIGLTFQMIPIFLTLLICRKLPGDDLASNLIHVGSFTFFFCLRSASIIGFIRAIKMLIDTYDFGFLEFVLFIVINVGVIAGSYFIYLNYFL